MRVSRALIGAACAGLMLTTSARQSGDAASSIKWLLNGPGVTALAASPIANQLLTNAAPFVLVGKNAPRVPASWNAVQVASFTSYGSIRQALSSATIPPDVRAILYDNERWQFTPAEEQHDPASFMQLAADLVHSRHLLFITAPAVNIVREMSSETGGSPYVRYLRLGLAANAARYADVYDIQAQGSERNVSRYAAFVNQAAAQARQANPRVRVLAGISTNPSGQHVSADDVVAAIDATRSSVDGYWLNIPRPSAYCPRCNDFRPDIAVEVLRRVDR